MRLIDADALIRVLEGRFERFKDLVPNIDNSIEFAHSYALNSVTNAPTISEGWIPCSERLPECGFGLHYLVTLKDGHDFMDDVYEAFFDKYGWHVGDNELACDDIIAWMPLPEPYKEADDEN